MPRISNNEVAWLGIDPGVSGGMALLYPSSQESLGGGGKVVLETSKMPSTDRDIWDWIREIGERFTEVFTVIEKVGGYTGEGQPGSRMFNFGANYGKLVMAVIASGYPLEEHAAGTWQRTFGMNRKAKEATTTWKNRLKSRAQQLYPNNKIILATSDATLIAEHARRYWLRINGS